ncbi:hypothetical protein RJ640_010842 [Escallonia rubra]|uniref:F-box domain-containing protein n=1 Tax=Escallonia rubra TaxID=112253 RepID=A0AA88U6C3_9ASTE|nr:hypothetical protein RJ640_010842 [Escallonia rubra]
MEFLLPNIPDDLVRDILYGLPVKSLLRFRSVSKRWRPLIDDPNFNFSTERRKVAVLLSSPIWLPVLHEEPFFLEYLSLQAIDDELNVDDLHPPRHWAHVPVHTRLLGSCNGLLLVSHGCDIFLWNPSTRCCKKVLKHKDWGYDATTTKSLLQVEILGDVGGEVGRRGCESSGGGKISQMRAILRDVDLGKGTEVKIVGDMVVGIVMGKGHLALLPPMAALLLFFLFVSASASDMSIIKFDETHDTKSSWRPDDEVIAVYEPWLVEHGKSYNGLGEKEKRFQIFKDNFHFIVEQNVANRSFKLGLNRFVDLTNEEYRSMYLGTKIDSKKRLAKGRKSDRDAPRAGDSLPDPN